MKKNLIIVVLCLTTIASVIVAGVQRAEAIAQKQAAEVFQKQAIQFKDSLNQQREAVLRQYRVADALFQKAKLQEEALRAKSSTK